MILTEVSALDSNVLPVRAFAEHLRLGTGFADDGSLDPVLELYLQSAIASIEARIGRALLSRSFVWSITRWRDERVQGLPLSPVQSVEAVKLCLADDTEVFADPEQWSLIRDSHRPRVIGRNGRLLPTIPRNGHVEIVFTAGHGANWEAVPADLRQAVFLLAAHFYENRSETGTSSGGMPFGVLVLLESYRAMRVGGGQS
jgi:uncharacterized phiE125 gp8 family phage protein